MSAARVSIRTRISTSAPRSPHCAEATAASARSPPSSARCATATTALGVSRMELEHYPGMTEAAIEAMIDEAMRRFEIRAARVIHRIGVLQPSAQIVLVAVTSAHRGQAFQACEFLMDYLKTQAPFWKKEAGAGRRALGRCPRRRRRRAGALGHRRRQRRDRAGDAPDEALSVPWLGIAAVSAGAVVGSLLRWGAGLWLNARWAGFPLGTLFVNCVGGLLIGAVLFWFERAPNELLRLLARHRLAGRLHDLLVVLGRVADHAAARPVPARARPHAGPRGRLAGVRGGRVPASPRRVLVALNQGGRGAALKTRPAPNLCASGGHPAMRLDKLTTKFQQALADAQSLAVAHDNAYIEPAHLLAAHARPGRRPEGAARARRRQRRPAADRRSRTRCKRLPQVQGGEQVVQPAASSAPAAAGREGSEQARRPVHRQRAVPARAGRRQGRHRRASLREHGADAQGARGGDRRGARRRRTSTAPKPKASARR